MNLQEFIHEQQQERYKSFIIYGPPSIIFEYLPYSRSILRFHLDVKRTTHRYNAFECLVA